MADADFLIIGGGIAGLSAASRLARHGRTILVEAEGAIGYHASGRSVSFSHYGIGNGPVRGLTACSRSFFERPPEGFSDAPIARRMPSLYFAEEEALPALDALGAEILRFAGAARWIGPEELKALCPALRTGAGSAVRALLDTSGLKLDADALLQGFARAFRRHGGEIRVGWRIAAIDRRGGEWQIRTEAGETLSAPVLFNAAGAWADRVAHMAEVAPIGLRPMRRTIIAVDPPPGTDAAAWPFVHSAAGDFYMLPEAGQLLVSPVDEVDDDPCDAQPEDYDLALAADRLEHYTSIAVTRIAHRWAGLRTFAPDRVPTAGFAPDAEGFFWLAGQGGYGLQTAPAMARIAELLVTGDAWPEDLAAAGVEAAHILPTRF